MKLTELETYYRLYLFDCGSAGKSPATLDNYTRRVGDFVRFMKNSRTSVVTANITADEVRLYLYSMQERKFARTTIHAHYRALKTFFNWLLAQDYLKHNPVLLVKLAKPLDPPVKPFSQADISKMLLLSSGERFINVRNRALILVFLDTGLRLKEMSSLHIESVDWEQGTIDVLGKGSKMRTVKLGITALRSLLHYKLIRNSPSASLWLSEERRPMTRDGIAITIRKLAIRAGITGTKLGPHTLRHTFATRCLENKADPFHVQSLMGHASSTMTRRYVQTVQSKVALEAHHAFSPADHLFKK